MKPKLFIGSSVESLEVANAAQENLEYDAEVTIWSQEIFDLSKTTMDSLLSALDVFDYGLFIFAPDDVTRMRGDVHQTVRDNVLFEIGLFIGRLGKERSFILLPRGMEKLHLPTDLLGVTPATYDSKRQDQNLTAALGPACNQIRKVIVKAGAIRRQATAAAAGLQWLPQLPHAYQLVQELEASKVYFIASFLGHTAPATRQILDHTRATVEIYCPDPDPKCLPAYALTEREGHIAALSALHRGKGRLKIYGTANPPSISAVIFADTDDSPLGAYLSWYTMYHQASSIGGQESGEQVTRSSGHWGGILIRRGVNEDANQLLSRAYDYLLFLRKDPTRHELMA